MKIHSFSGKYRFLSNFYLFPMEIDGHIWPTVEHYFQAQKTLDKKAQQLIRQAPTPGKAKRMGRKVQLRNDWESAKETFMLIALKAKFKPGSDLANLLINTYPNELIERNNWGDMYWGVCNEQGSNRLGKLLMLIRKELMAFE